MYKAIKRTAALALALCIILSLLCACGGTASKTETPDNTNTTNTPGETNFVRRDAGRGLMVPLVEETITLTWWGEGSVSQGVISDMSENGAYRQLEAMTNVHIDFQLASDTSDALTTFLLMINSGDICDFLVGVTQHYPSGLSGALEEGVIIDMTDLVKNHMPNYFAHLSSSEVALKAATMEDGSILAVWPLQEVLASDGIGPFIRMDWLDDLGFELPTTYDELYTILTAFKTEKGAGRAFALPTAGAYINQSFVAGYGIAGCLWPEMENQPWYQVGGEVRYGIIQPEFKEYLTMLNQWYNERLISSDYITKNTTPVVADPTDIVTGQTGLFFTGTFTLEMIYGQAENADFKLSAIPEPVRNKGDQHHLGGISPSPLGRVGTGISTDCEYPEIAAEWLDYCFTDEGAVINSCGIEGESFEYVDGEIVYTDLILKHPDYSISVMLACYTTQNPRLVLDVYNKARAGETEAAITADDIWASQLSDERYEIPKQLELAAEDSAEYAKLYSDIQTYAQEMIGKFILGPEPLDGFDSYVAEIRRMGIDTCAAMYQRAMDKYNAR